MDGEDMTIRDILEELRCINCDGSGGLQVSEDEVEQCQFCYEIRYPFIDQAETAINAYILGEVMELIGEDENKKVVDWDCPCGTQHHLESDYYQRNQLRQELRNKANERWGK